MFIVRILPRNCDPITLKTTTTTTKNITMAFLGVFKNILCPFKMTRNFTPSAGCEMKPRKRKGKRRWSAGFRAQPRAQVHVAAAFPFCGVHSLLFSDCYPTPPLVSSLLSMGVSLYLHDFLGKLGGQPKTGIFSMEKALKLTLQFIWIKKSPKISKALK